MNGPAIGFNLGRRVAVGWFTHGNCWTFRGAINRYHTCTYYRFWRLFMSVDKKETNA